MVVVDPRRTETAKVADEHHFVRPGTDAVRAAGDAARAVRRGAHRAPAAYVDGVAAVAAAVAEFTPERAEAVSGVPADEIRRLTRELAAADGGRGLRPDGRLDARASARSASGRSSCLNLLTGNFDREGGVLFPEPAVDAVGRRIDRPRPLRRLAQPGPRPPGVRRRAAGRGAAARRSRRPGEGQIRALLTMAGNPVLSTPDGAALARGARRARLHGGDRHLPQRDHPARRRHPAADDRARARPLRPRLPRRWRCATPRASPRRCFRSRRTPRHDWEIFRDLTAAGRRPGCDRKPPLKERLVQRARLSASPTLRWSGAARRPGAGLTWRSLRKNPAGVDLGPLRADHCPRGCRPKDKRIDLAPAAGRRTTSTGWRRTRRRAARRRAAADRAPAPAATTTPGCTTPPG